MHAELSHRLWLVASDVQNNAIRTTPTAAKGALLVLLERFTRESENTVQGSGRWAVTVPRWWWRRLLVFLDLTIMISRDWARRLWQDEISRGFVYVTWLRRIRPLETVDFPAFLTSASYIRLRGLRSR